MALGQSKSGDPWTPPPGYHPGSTVATAQEPQVTWLGDSFAEGTGAANFPSSGFVGQVCAAERWACDDQAEGSTGYVANNAVVQYPDRKPVPGHLQSVIAEKPDMVIIAAGLNDDGSTDTSLAKVSAAAGDTFQQIKKNLPKTRVIVIGPFWPDGNPGPSVLNVRGVIRDQATQAGFSFIDPIAEQWITGTRGVSGLALKYTGPDNTHPTQAGHDNIARHLLVHFQQLRLPAGPKA